MAKFSAITPGIMPEISQRDIVFLTCPGHFRRRNLNRIDPICIALPKVAKASTVVTDMWLLRVAVVDGFANKLCQCKWAISKACLLSLSLSVCIPVCPYTRLSVYPSVHSSANQLFYFSVSVTLYVHPYLPVPVHLPIQLSNSLYVCLCTCPSLCLFIHLSVCLYICQYIFKVR